MKTLFAIMLLAFSLNTYAQPIAIGDTAHEAMIKCTKGETVAYIKENKQFPDDNTLNTIKADCLVFIFMSYEWVRVK